MSKRSGPSDVMSVLRMFFLCLVIATQVTILLQTKNLETLRAASDFVVLVSAVVSGVFFFSPRRLLQMLAHSLIALLAVYEIVFALMRIYQYDPVVMSLSTLLSNSLAVPLLIGLAFHSLRSAHRLLGICE